MKFNTFNLVVKENETKYRLQLMMPDGSGNYLHTLDYNDVNDALEVRDSLIGIGFKKSDLHVEPDQGYYRISIKVKDNESILHTFHSRKLNLIDIIYERDMLIDLRSNETQQYG